ncbi:DUF192 domain-containing protein [Balneolaceae bacterium ANBcel3]|nr:DUF192 domain-containing protein [Balneolaceae bacterium ANBcel3]
MKLFPWSMLLFLILASSCSEDEPTERQGRTIDPNQTVVILDEEGREITEVRVAIADSEYSRNLGLMDVHDLPMDTGMLFIFEDERPRSFWMVNTPLPLDMLFADRHGEIVRIRTNTVPYSDRQVTSGHPAKYVLEVNAGFSYEFDIREGMRIERR